MVHPELIGFGPFFSSQLSLEEARVESYRKLTLELARQARRREGGAARAERERWKEVSKDLRRLSRERRRRARAGEVREVLRPKQRGGAVPKPAPSRRRSGG